MKVDRQELLMVFGIVGAFTVVAQIAQAGLWAAVLFGVIAGAIAAGAYWALMPFVLRWAAKGAKQRQPDPDDEAQDGEPPAKS